MHAADWAIDLRGVSKTYARKVRALRGVDIRVGRAEIFGLLGPNGAGKSTLVKIMMTVVLPDAAEGTILGQPLGHKPSLRSVGYLPEGHRFPPYLTGQGVLDFYARLSKVPAEKRRRQSAYWLDRLGMTKWANTRITQYSKGMMQRVGLAQALVHEPDLILLDEPTDGVDPGGRREIREILLELKDAGKTVFVNSHILTELEMVCDRVAILVNGQVARQGTVRELTAHTVWYEVTTVQPITAHIPALEALGATCDGQVLSIQGADAEAINRLIDCLRTNQILIHAVEPKRWSLEDVYDDVAEKGIAKGL